MYWFWVLSFELDFGLGLGGLDFIISGFKNTVSSRNEKCSKRRFFNFSKLNFSLKLKIRLEVLVKKMEANLLQTTYIGHCVCKPGSQVRWRHMDTIGICPNPTNFCGQAASQSKYILYCFLGYYWLSILFCQYVYLSLFKVEVFWEGHKNLTKSLSFFDVRDRPFKTSANLYDFWPLPPSCRPCLSPVFYY